MASSVIKGFNLDSFITFRIARLDNQSLATSTTKTFYIPLTTVAGYPNTKIEVIDAWTNDGRVITLNRYIDVQNMRVAIDCRNTSTTNVESSLSIVVKVMYMK